MNLKYFKVCSTFFFFALIHKKLTKVIENMRELASDLVKKAKEIDALIEVLPGIDQTEDEQVRKRISRCINSL